MRTISSNTRAKGHSLQDGSGEQDEAYLAAKLIAQKDLQRLLL